MTTPEVVEALAAWGARCRGTLGLTGRLIGCSLPERDGIFAAEAAAVEARLAEARAEAGRTGRAVELDGSPLSLANSGDIWTVHPGGEVTRSLQRFPEFDALTAGLEPEPLPAAGGEGTPPAREDIWDAALQALWCPSATNWQPIRLLELPPETREPRTRVLQLRRDHYESLLGDVLEPFGLEVTAREEHVDAGIFSQSFRVAFAGLGGVMGEEILDEAGIGRLRTAALRECARRGDRLAGLNGPAAAHERDKLALLLAQIESGKAIPDAVWTLTGRGPRTPAIRELIFARTTQRVASPTGRVDPAAYEGIFEGCLKALPQAQRAQVRQISFAKEHPVAAAIGKEMFEALYGRGADPETKSGGSGGLLAAITPENLVRWALRKAPASLPEPLRAAANTEGGLAAAAKSADLPAAILGPYIRDRLTRDGKYRTEGGRVVAEGGKAMSIGVYVRVVRALASTFGTFFLRFQNTHPVGSIVLSRVQGDGRLGARAAGRQMAVVSLAARAHGYTGILKSGPIDLAKEGIRALVSGLLRERGQAEWAAALAAGEWDPAMTFQLGLPLGPGEIIDPGTPDEHTGMEERKRDKRPPREDSVGHFLPWFE